MPDVTVTAEQRETLLHDLALTFFVEFDTEISRVDDQREFLEDCLRVYDDLKRKDRDDYPLTAAPDRLERVLRRLIDRSEQELADIDLDPPHRTLRQMRRLHDDDPEALAEEVAHYERRTRSRADANLDVASVCRAVLQALEAEGGR